MKRCLLTLLCVFLMMAPLPDAALAASAEGELWVNGVNILADPDQTVECGGGTATYAKVNGEHTLTLNNATITAHRHDKGIMSTGNDIPLTIRLEGTNIIKGNDIVVGIRCHGKLKVYLKGYDKPATTLKLKVRLS